jgi:hypothetical protein
VTHSTPTLCPNWRKKARLKVQAPPLRGRDALVPSLPLPPNNQ